MADDYLHRVRASLASGELTDLAFGALLPPLTRAKSLYHWTPIAVARCAALRFAERGVSRVLDVGCGPGKFCVAAALARPKIDFCGIERGVDLATTAKELATRLRLPNVEFRAGDALGVPWHDFDGFYFFNPFGGNSTTRLAGGNSLSHGNELVRVAELLGEARKGATVITYHGLGGPIPSSYDLLSEELVGSGPLRVWVKTRSREAAWSHIDRSHGVLRVPRKHLEQALGDRRPSAVMVSE